MNRFREAVPRWSRFLTVGFILATPVTAMDVGGRLSVGAIYSDNVTLESDGFEDDDFILRADPTIYLASVGRRYDFRLDYTLEALYYRDQPDSTEVFSQGQTILDIEILEERLFLNSLASISQVVVDPTQSFSTGNIPQIGNRSDQTRYQTGPEWRQDLFGTVLNVRYDIGHVDYDDDAFQDDDEALQDADYQNLTTDWTGPERDRGLTWEVHHEYRKYEYEISDDAVRQLAELSLIYEIGSGWAPFVSGGMESDLQDRTDASLTDGIWRAGLRRNTARTFFEMYAGERSFGSSWGAAFERQYSPDSGDIFRISYNETPRTSEDELDATLEKPTGGPGSPSPPGPVLPPPVVPPGVIAPGTGRFFLSKRGDILLAKAFNRNTVSLNVFHEDDESLEVGTPADGDKTRQTGLSLVWAYQLGANTQAIVDGYYASREFSRAGDPDDSDEIFRSRLGLNYQLGARTLVSGWVGREERTGSAIDSRNYTENQVGLSVGRTF